MAHNKAYHQAEKKIEEALVSGARELNLSTIFYLTELPPTLWELQRLNILKLGDRRIKAGNKLFEISDKIEQLTELQFLDISFCNIRKLPSQLGKLSKLESLHISYNELTAIPESLGQLKQLNELNLSNNQLTILPDSLGELIKLKTLYLYNNQLTTLPDSLGKLTQLTELSLSSNRLRTLPDWLGGLSQLTTLYLSDNQLTTLPEWLRGLIQLRELGLSSNRLRTLPDWLGGLSQLITLYLSDNQLTTLPEWLGGLVQIEILDIRKNRLKSLPDSLSNLINLREFDASGNPIGSLPVWIKNFKNLHDLVVNDCEIVTIPDWINQLNQLEKLDFSNNYLTYVPENVAALKNLISLFLDVNNINDLAPSLAQLENLEELTLDDNPLRPALQSAYDQGLDAVKAYLRAKSKGEIILNEAKLILIGEGEVGKTCLMDALLNELWHEHPSTHGIEIQSFNVTTDIQTTITLNAWDFGGQRVYRPTHQLFFSAPAVYLVVWKPREGSQAGQVKEWIQLVKRREPSAKILVVATHGGPQQRQPDIDRQELWDLFGKDTVVDFFFVESKPDEHGNRKGIDELKSAIAQVAASLPEVGRSVPKSFADVRQALQDKGAPYLPLREVLDICRIHNMDDEIARLFITISHRLGHLTHYENDPTLRDIVILRPDWLATAMSYVLDDEATRTAHGLVKFSRLSQLWDDKNRTDDSRYHATLHPIFLRLMERFDLSYRVADLTSRSDSDPVSLIGQLVPDIRPQNISDAWKSSPASGDIQQTQICHIVDASNGQSASAEGLFYQLIVRLHKYSLGRADYNASVHWQRGLVLEDEYKSRAFLEHVGNDVRITVRSPYPEGLLGMLTREVKFLVESFWEGLRCDVMVPCIEPCGKNNVGTGLFEVEKLMTFKRQGMTMFPCMVSGCNQAQDIDALLRNAPAATAPISLDYLEKKFTEVVNKMNYQGEKIMNRFDRVDDHDRRILSMADKIYTDLLQVLKDEAKEGPRLFSLVPVNRSGFNPKQWTSEKFKLILWCEHARKPLPFINGKDSQDGVYEIERTREWFVKAAPFLKIMTQALSLALPITTAGIKLEIDKAAYDFFADQIAFSKEIIDATLSASDEADLWKDTGDSAELPQGFGIRAENATLRELHAFLKAKDPGFGGLVRVMNKRQEFLWVHEKFAGEY